MDIIVLAAGELDADQRTIDPHRESCAGHQCLCAKLRSALH